MVVCEAFLRIEPNKDLFGWLFKIKSQRVLGFTDGVLAPMGEMNIQKHSRVSHVYLCLPLRSLNSS
jgi:hypothetical protein